MTMHHRIDTGHIGRIADHLRLALGDDFDEQAFLDTLDGEADTDDIADALIDAMQDAAAMAGAVKVREDDLAARRKRYEVRAAAYRRGALDLLAAMGVKKLERPAATLSRRAGGVSLRITDEADIPSQLTKTTVAPDKAAIKAVLQAGETVPGAELVQGDETISVRVR